MKYLRIVEAIFWISVMGFCHVQAGDHSDGDPDNESGNADETTTHPSLAACIIMRNDPVVNCIVGHFREFYKNIQSKPDVISNLRTAVGFTEENLGNIDEIISTKDMLNLTQVTQTWIVYLLGMKLTNTSLDVICQEVIKLENGLRTCDIGETRNTNPTEIINSIQIVHNETTEVCQSKKVGKVPSCLHSSMKIIIAASWFCGIFEAASSIVTETVTET